MYREPYQFNVERYIDPERFAKIRDFSQKLPTPSLIVDLDLIAKKFDELSSNFPIADIYYAVKACPNPEILKVLIEA